MGGQIDEISQLLGKLVANSDEQAKKASAIFAKLDTMQKENHESLGIAREGLRLATEVKTRLELEVLPEIEQFKKLKNRSIGALLVLMLMSGASGAAITRVITKFFG